MGTGGGLVEYVTVQGQSGKSLVIGSLKPWSVPGKDILVMVRVVAVVAV